MRKCMGMRGDTLARDCRGGHCPCYVSLPLPVASRDGRKRMHARAHTLPVQPARCLPSSFFCPPSPFACTLLLPFRRVSCARVCAASQRSSSRGDGAAKRRCGKAQARRDAQRGAGVTQRTSHPETRPQPWGRGDGTPSPMNVAEAAGNLPTV